MKGFVHLPVWSVDTVRLYEVVHGNRQRWGIRGGDDLIGCHQNFVVVHEVSQQGESGECERSLLCSTIVEH